MVDQLTARLRGQRQLAVLVAAAAVTALLAYRLAAGHRHLPEALLVVAVGYGILRRPQLAFVGWLVIVASVLPQRVLPVGALGVRSDLGEALGFAILAAVVVHLATHEPLRRPEIVWPFAVLMLAAVVGAVVASSYGAVRADWLAPLKSLVLYLLPVAMLALHRTEQHLQTLEKWILRICVAGSVLTFVSLVTGVGGSGDQKDVVTMGFAAPANRLRPAVLHLVLLGILLLVARCTTQGFTPRRIAALALFTALVAFSFTRSTWVPLAIALLLFALRHPAQRLPLRGLRTSVTLICVALVAFAAASSGTLGPSMKAATLRVESIGTPQVFQENSYQIRASEDTIAWSALNGHKVLGIGLGRPYGGVVIEHDPMSNRTVKEPRKFIHNSYLNTWLGLGLLGLLAWAMLAWAVVREATRARRDRSPNGARRFAAACVLLALGLEAIFQTDLYNRAFLATLTCAIVFLVGPKQAQEQQ
ncbi:MAG TPA: O-antigen ligase family protein [Mycobacteriales bacterium]|nr:O-antigen ligase family protein [Mycobacteriales bacterium]